MKRSKFLKTFGGVYERSAWVAKNSWDKNLKMDNAAQLARLMSKTMHRADHQTKLALIRAHPDLAGKAAIAGELTTESTSEQKAAGLDQCSPEEFAEFTRLNAAYTDKFAFPFIIAVKGHDRSSILQAFKDRLQNDVDQEFAEALRQIDHIASFRIEEIYQ